MVMVFLFVAFSLRTCLPGFFQSEDFPKTRESIKKGRSLDPPFFAPNLP